MSEDPRSIPNVPGCLVDRDPQVSPERLLTDLVPPPHFASVRFSTYAPDPGQPSQAAAVAALEAFGGRLEQRPSRRWLRKAAPPEERAGVYLDGGFGVGKTHLLHAIGHYAMSLYPGIRVRYVSSEEFTNDFINSIANNRGAAFQARYRDVDILLIDDIQFLQGRAETQEAFFHTFNTLHDHDKQVVITSDVPPRHLTGFEDRMRSRFEWGLITDVQAPDLETRIAILRKKAQAERLQVPDDILEYMASKVSSNIRELEGILIRVTAYSSVNHQPVDIDLAQTLLKDLVSLDDTNVVMPVDIINHAAAYFKLSVDDLYGSNRSQQIAHARQVAMYLCREMTDLSLPKIGEIFGGRDHTTVMHADRKIRQLMAERRSIYNQVTELTNRIKQQARA